MTEGITTTHIGSLPRTPEILDHLEESGTGELPQSLVAEATREVIERQAEVGIDVANNGEQGRTGFHIHVLDRLSGFSGEGVAPFWGDVRDFPELAEAEFDYPDADPETGAPLRPAVTGPIEYQGEAAARAELETFFESLEAAGADVEGTFMTAPSPGIVATSLPNQHYDSHEEYLFAVADALRTEYGIIADSEATLQVDAPDLMHTHHREFHDGRSFQDLSVAEYREVVATHVEAINRALGDVPAGEVRLHTCWGNYEGPHHRDIALADVLPELYELDVGTLAVEGSSPRHAHEYRAFEEHPLPGDMQLMPGVVDVKTNIIEHPETVADRLERAAEVVGDPSRIVAAPDCGFGTLAWSAAVEEIAWAKLESLVEGAEIASERLG
ncbi:MAG: cobalamin-independent methionine synthase II family protein [Halobacteriales archaeon]